VGIVEIPPRICRLEGAEKRLRKPSIFPRLKSRVRNGRFDRRISSQPAA